MNRLFGRDTYEDFRVLASNSDIDLLDAMLLLCESLDPQVNSDECRDLIDELADRIRPQIDDGDDEATRVIRMVAALRDLGFRGNTEHYFDQRNTLLSEVLVRRTGIPISLSVLFMEVGQRLGIAIRGVGFPYHFLLKAVDVPGLFVDPFFLVTRDEKSCEALLDEVSGGMVDFRDEYLRTVEARQVFVRVLRNLKNLHKQAGSIRAALEYCELILMFDPEQAPEYRDRGTTCLALGEWNRAVDDLSTYLAMTPNAPDRAQILGQLQWVLTQQNSVH